jgi:hypothetical protein
LSGIFELFPKWKQLIVKTGASAKINSSFFLNTPPLKNNEASPMQQYRNNQPMWSDQFKSLLDISKNYRKWLIVISYQLPL